MILNEVEKMHAYQSRFKNGSINVGRMQKASCDKQRFNKEMLIKLNTLCLHLIYN